MGKRDLYWFLVSEVSVSHGEENMAEQNSSQLGGQEAEKETIEVTKTSR